MSDDGVSIEISIEELRKRKIFVGVPMYGGQCYGHFAKSMTDLCTLCNHYGIDLKIFYLFNESLIARARNYIADEFMRSESTHLMFVDADIGFNPNDPLALAAMAAPDSDKDIICGAYAKKTIAWEKIKVAVDKGMADENPNNLENFVGDFVFNPVSAGELRVDQPAEVMEAGTGFMMIPRWTFEKFSEAYPEYKYLPDHVRTKNFDGSREITAFFQDPIDPVSRRHLSEDYFFCQKARAAGMKVWICPWMRFQHAGTYMFGGSLVDMARVGASGTADAEQIKKWVK